MGTDGDCSLNKPSVVVSQPLAAAVDITVNIKAHVYYRVGSSGLELLSTEEIVPVKTVYSIKGRG